MPHVIGVLEGTGNTRRVFNLSRSSSKPVLCGEDELLFASLSCGASGGILPGANVDSEQFVEVYELFRAGKIEEAHRQFERLLPLVQFLFSEPDHAALHWLMAERGQIPHADFGAARPSNEFIYFSG